MDSTWQGKRSLVRIVREQLFSKTRAVDAVVFPTDKGNVERISTQNVASTTLIESESKLGSLTNVETNSGTDLEKIAKDSEERKLVNDLEQQFKSLKTVDSKVGTSSEEQSKSPKPAKSKHGKKEIVSSSTVFPRLEVCLGKKCKARGSEDLLTEFQTAGQGKVEIAYTKCMKQCKLGVNVRVTQDGSTFDFCHEVPSTDVEKILCKHFDW